MSPLAHTEAGKKHSLVGVSIVSKLDCLSQVGDGGFDVSQFVEAFEATALTSTQPV